MASSKRALLCGAPWGAVGSHCAEAGAKVVPEPLNEYDDMLKLCSFDYDCLLNGQLVSAFLVRLAFVIAYALA